MPSVEVSKPSHVLAFIDLVESNLGPIHRETAWWEQHTSDGVITEKHVKALTRLLDSLRDGSFSLRPDSGAGVALSCASPSPAINYYLRFLNLADDLRPPGPGRTACFRLGTAPDHAPSGDSLLVGSLTANRSQWDRRARFAAIVGGRYDGATEWLELLPKLDDDYSFLLEWIRRGSGGSSMSMLKDMYLRPDSPYRDKELLRLLRSSHSARAGWVGTDANRTIKWDSLVPNLAMVHFKTLLNRKSIGG